MHESIHTLPGAMAGLKSCPNHSNHLATSYNRIISGVLHIGSIIMVAMVAEVKISLIKLISYYWYDSTVLECELC